MLAELFEMQHINHFNRTFKCLREIQCKQNHAIQCSPLQAPEYYITKMLCGSEEACRFISRCACVSPPLPPIPDDNWASVLFPVVNPHPHPLHTHTLPQACSLAAGDIITDSTKTGPLEGMTSLFITDETKREREERCSSSYPNPCIWVLLIYNQRPMGGHHREGRITEAHLHTHSLAPKSMRKVQEKGRVLWLDICHCCQEIKRTLCKNINQRKWEETL